MTIVPHSVTDAMPRITQLHLHIVDTDDVVQTMTPFARLLDRRLREEIAFIEEQETGAFAAFRTSPLEHAATWDVSL